MDFPAPERPTTPIFSPGRETEASGGGLPLTHMRELLAQVVAARRAAGDADIRYLDGLSLFSEADAHLLPGIALDQHLVAAGREFPGAGRRHGDPELAVLDLAGHADAHRNLLSFVRRPTVRPP